MGAGCMMRAQTRRKTRCYFCPEERDGAPKNSECGVIISIPLLGSGAASVWGDGEAELSVHGAFPELPAVPSCLRGTHTRSQTKTPATQPIRFYYSLGKWVKIRAKLLI